MADDKTLFEQSIAFLQNNPVVVGMMLVSAIVTGLATFTNAIRDLGKSLAGLFQSPTISAGSKDKPIRLSAIQIGELLVGKVEHGMIIEPTIPEMEGNRETWYDAYYYDDGRMLYRRKASAKTDKWFWSLDSRGLCRGNPHERDKMFCRNIESIGDGWYQSVGYNSGKVRCIFKVESGKPEDVS